jgi:hypothetical protein
MQGLPVHRALLDLLQVRYLLQPADQPCRARVAQRRATGSHAYDFARRRSRAAAVQGDREPDRDGAVFVVPHAAPLPDRPQVLETLKRTDFRRTVLLEPAGGVAAPVGGEPSDGFRRAAEVERYHPTEVVIQVGDGPRGYLVLADVWFPGWVCTMDGEPRTIHRANYLFRAVPVEAGAHRWCFASSRRCWRADGP